MTTPLRIGIVGCGGIAHAHLEGYNARDDVAIAAVYDVSTKAAQRMARMTGGVVAESLEQMANDMDLDAVSICTPTGVHAANCLPFLDANVAVLCEKPLAIDPEKAADLAVRAAKNSAPFMVGFCHRFHGPIIELKRLLEDGYIGRPLLFRNLFCSYTELANNHRRNVELSGGGIIMDNCSHSVDLFRHLMGEPDSVFAIGGTVVQQAPIEDFGMLGLGINDRTFGDIASSYSFPVGSSWLEVFGENGTARVSYWNRGEPELTVQRRGERDRYVVDCSGHPMRFVGQVGHFVDCVKTGEQPRVSADDGLATCRVIAAAYESVRYGQRIAICA